MIIIKYLVEDGAWFTKTVRGNPRLGPWKVIQMEQALGN